MNMTEAKKEDNNNAMSPLHNNFASIVYDLEGSDMQNNQSNGEDVVLDHNYGLPEEEEEIVFILLKKH